jgi:Bcr/CflA subfamily drug resistance transporter
MKKTLLPLLILIVGLPQLSETVYTPSLPDIAQALGVSDAWVEYTLTIYLAGFAVGTLFWGRLSDRLGRRPCILVGLLIYILGCIGCFYSSSIEALMWSRFLQAFGGSIGSVLGQAICRDIFQGAERGKVFSIIGSAIAFSPAIGPVLGGIIDQTFGWAAIFLLLILLGILTLTASYLKLPETHIHSSIHAISLKKMAMRLMKDHRVLAYGFLVAACNGIPFSFYAEGSFYLIELLGLSPSTYGMSFIGIALAGALGGWLSRRKHEQQVSSITIMKQGIALVIMGSAFFLGMTVIIGMFDATPKWVSIVLTLGSMMVIMLGDALIIPNALSMALEDYKHSIGTASSLFGFFYYVLISLFTFGMGLLHNGTLFPMPCYFFVIGLFMWFVMKGVTSQRQS